MGMTRNEEEDTLSKSAIYSGIYMGCLEPNKSVTVEPCDFEGPLSSKVVQKRDWFLWLAWTFVIVCSVYAFIGSLYGQAFIARVRILWQEHQHIE